jgi:hypothetical protein
MLSLLLLGPFVQQPGSISHAALHPTALDMYVELPDAAIFQRLLERAPIGQLVHDPELLGSLAGLLKRPDLSEEALRGMIDGSPEQALARLGMPPEALRNAGISLSINGLRSTLPKALERVAKWKLAHDAVVDYTERLHALEALPETLSELPEAEGQAPRDPWGNEYTYERDAATNTFSIRSLGANGIQGGAEDDTDVEIDSDFASVSAALISNSFGLTLAISFENEAHAKTLHAQFLAKVETSAELGAVGQNGEQTFGVAGLNAWLDLDGSLVLLGVGDSKAADVLTRLHDHGTGRSAEPSTNARAIVAAAQARLGAPQGEVVWFGYQAAAWSQLFGGAVQATMGLDTSEQNPLQSLAPMLARLAPEVGSTSVASPCAWRTEFDGKSFRALSIEPIPSTGIAAMLGRTPIDPAEMKAIPASAQAFWTTSIDGAGMGKLLFELLGQQNGQSAEEWLASTEKSTGVRLDKALFDNLGSSTTFYVLPWKAIGLPPILSVTPLRNVAAFEACIEHLGALLPAEMGESARINTRPYKDVPITTISGANVAGGIVALQPAMCVLDGSLYLASSPSPLKEEIRRIKEGKSAPHAALAGLEAGSVNAGSAYYIDWANILGDVLAIGSNLAKMMGGDDLPIDVSKLPKRELLVKHVRPTTSRTELRDGWSYTITQGSFGPETPLLILAGAGAVSAIAERTEAAPSEQFAASDAAATQAPTEPTPLTASDATQLALQQVRNALAIYKVDRSSYPATLRELSAPSANYPQGYVASGSLPQDGWGRDLHYELLAATARYRLWSAGADGIDQNGAGDDWVAGAKK